MLPGDNGPQMRALFELTEMLVLAHRQCRVQTSASLSTFDKDSVNIVLGVHLVDEKVVSAIPDGSIVLNTEIFGDDDVLIDVFVRLSKRTEIWESSEKNREVLRQRGVTAKKFLPGLAQGREKIKDSVKDVDVILWGELDDKKESVVTQLKSKGMSVLCASGNIGAEWEEKLARARVYLDLPGVGERISTLRQHFLLQNSVPVVGVWDSPAKIDAEAQALFWVTDMTQAADACALLVRDERLREIQLAAVQTWLAARPVGQTLESLWADAAPETPTRSPEHAPALPAVATGNQLPWRWSLGMSRKLRIPFHGSEEVSANYSQAWQDIFILSMLNGKRNGSYLEVGGHVPIENNNTYLLSKKFGWSGVSIEFDPSHFPFWLKERPESRLLIADALEIDYRELLEKSFTDTRRVDYLQLDIDPSINTLSVLKRIPLKEWRFSVITFETDAYTRDTRARDESREILSRHGYMLLASDISVLYPPVSSEPIPFEDWWIDPESIERRAIEKASSVKRFSGVPQEILFDYDT
jgi:hypothetical protein